MIYESIRIGTGFRADLVVEDKVIVEIKSVDLIAPVHKFPCSISRSAIPPMNQSGERRS